MFLGSWLQGPETHPGVFMHGFIFYGYLWKQGWKTLWEPPSRSKAQPQGSESVLNSAGFWIIWTLPSLHWTVFICHSESILLLSSPGSVTRQADLNDQFSCFPGSGWVWLVGGTDRWFGKKIPPKRDPGWCIYSSSPFLVRSTCYR